MRKIYFVLVMVLLCAGYTQAQRRFYADIQLQKVGKKSEKARYKIKRRKKNGLYVVKAFRNDNGSLAITGSFRDKALKIKQGTFIYYSLATKRRVMHYDNNQAHGVYEEYDKQGQLQTKGQFVKGKQAGVFYTYTQGKLSQEANYTQGVLEGTCKQYKDGILVAQGKYQQGKRMGWWTVRENGKKCQIKYFKGIALGAFKLHHKNLYSIVKVANDEKGSWGVIDQYGKWVIQATGYIHNVMNTPFYVVSAGKHKTGMIHVRKGVVVPLIYSSVSSPSDGRIRIEKGRKYGYTDYEGKIVIPCKYNDALSFDKKVAKITLNNKYYEIDLNGKVLKKLKKQPIHPIPKVIHEPSGFNRPFMNVDGVTIQYERTQNKQRLCGIRIRQLKGKGNKVASSGTISYQWIPEEYADIRFMNGMFIFKKNKRWGIMNDRWEVIAKPVFIQVYGFWEK